jgi:outer membrane protein
MLIKAVWFALGGVLTALAQAPAPTPPAAQAPAPRKLATIHIQSAIASTKQGQKAAQDLQSKFDPRRQALEKRQAQLAGMQQQMRSGAATMSPAAREKLTRDIDTSTTSLKRDSEDYDAEVREEQGKIMSDIGQKMMELIGKHASANGIALVVDVSNPQSAILWADSSLDITTEMVKQYDLAYPPPAAAPAPPAPAPAKK